VEWTVNRVSADALARGVRTGISVQPGDVLRFSYPDSSPEITPSSVRLADRSITAKVASKEFPTNVTADNYPEMAARLFCPD
jgi:hypothetical protein